MSEPTAQRTLVKSPPELWAELSDVTSLAKHLGEFGEIRITRVEPETTVVWEGERASGTVELEPSGWGTKVTLTAETEEQVAKAGFWGRLKGAEPAPSDNLEEKLSEVLDDLGRPHKRPFSRGS